MNDLSSLLRRHGKQLLLALVGAIAPLSVHAHVKWFSSIVDTRVSPLTPLEVISSPLFMGIGLMAAAVLFVVAHIDGRISHRSNSPMRLAVLLEQLVGEFISPILRVGVAVYFAAAVLYFRDSPIILTPELKTTAIWVPVLQVTIAVTALSRHTVLTTALGIVLLYAYGVNTYGWFHMLDYPVFIGIAAFLGVDSAHGMDKRALMLTVLRVTTGFTLLWAGVEKWLYPEWSYDLLEHDLRVLLIGFTPEFVVLGAGFVEFCLAFVLIFGRLASQIASGAFLVLMILAIPLAGVVDMIGHLPFILALFILATTRNSVGLHPQSPNGRWHALSHADFFVVSVWGSIGAYYVSHELAYSGSRPIDWTMALLASCLATLLISRILQTAPRSLSSLWGKT